jgi:peptidoglycan/LPS O-acetylase OafA/YrhL
MTVVSAVETPASARDARSQSGSFRGDLQGLRGIAVLLVVVYHAGVPFVPGGFVGVDVFFVISGFLITGLILREIDATGRLSLGRFYARRARRLLPAASVVLVFVAAMTIAVLPVTRWQSVSRDIVASSLDVVNWSFAARSVDYLAQSEVASPVQHFWSLAVEEQFYLVWPVLIVLIVWFLRRVGGSRIASRRYLAVGLLAIAGPSFAWSWYETAHAPGPAYFVTTTRLWELAIGALVAVGTTRLVRVPVRVRVVAGWAGLVAVAAAALLFDESVPFPGLTAAVPTIGAAAVIVAGLGVSRGLPALRLPALQDVGNVSYSLYLWHWPLLVGATVIWGDEQGHLWAPTALLVVGFAAVPAWLAYRVVEQPLHHARALVTAPWRAGVVAVVCVALGIGSAVAVSSSFSARGAQAGGGDVHPGAAVLGTATPSAAVPSTSGPFSPSAVQAKDDMQGLDGSVCIADVSRALQRCSYGPADSDTVVAVVGDSKMHQWLDALAVVADDRGWRLETYLVSACPFIVGSPQLKGSQTSHCRRLNEERLQAVAESPEVDAVLVSQVSAKACVDRACTSATPAAMGDGLRQALGRLQDAGKQVVVFADNQHPEMDEMECVARNAAHLVECDFERRDARDVPLLNVAADLSLPVVDLRPWICPGDTCSAVIGGVLVYRQGSHLTATYVRSLAAVVGRQLTAAGLS